MTLPNPFDSVQQSPGFNHEQNTPEKPYDPHSVGDLLQFAKDIEDTEATQVIQNLQALMLTKNEEINRRNETNTVTEVNNLLRSILPQLTRSVQQINTTLNGSGWIQEIYFEYKNGIQISQELAQSFRQIQDLINSGGVVNTNYIHLPAIRETVRRLDTRFTEFSAACKKLESATDAPIQEQSWGGSFGTPESERTNAAKEVLEAAGKFSNNLQDLPPNNFGRR